MQHPLEREALRKHTVSFLVCTTLLTTPVSTAQANPLDGVVRTATSSPLVTFGLGCAVGAVVGGLAVGLSGKRARRRLEEEIDEVVKTAERAEESARRAEALLAEHETAMITAQGTQNVQSAQSTQSVQSTQNAQNTQSAQKMQSTNVLERVEPAKPLRADLSKQQRDSAVAAKAVATPQKQDAKAKEVSKDVDPNATGKLSRAKMGRGSGSSKDKERSFIRRHGLHATGSLIDLPVIDRGAERPASDSPFVTRRVQRRQFDPTVRANIIDRRVPRFDESLYPDTTNEQHQDIDMFETAMRAMDATLSETEAPEPVTMQTTADLGRVASVMPATSVKPDISDTSSYIDYLVQDELERNRSGAGRRFSRAHLTMFEGTGDLGAARKAMQYRPRHMQKASKEA